MDFITYQQLFEGILTDPNPQVPYDNQAYVHYTQLNWSRQQRWLKTGILDEDLVAFIEAIDQEQTWVIITEPWCGDAAHTIPFMQRLAELNPLIKVDYQLRDSPPFLIEQYLTNGTKSIPKLIITNTANNHQAVWGSRPAECQALYYQMLKDNVDMDQRKIALQQWYNNDKGKSFQLELLAILTSL